MKRRGWAAATLAGLCGVTAWGGDPWVASVQAPTPPQKPLHEKPATAAELVWKSSATSKPAVTGPWQPSGSVKRTSSDIEWMASQDDAVDNKLQTTIFNQEPIPIPVPSAPATPAAPPTVAPSPRQIDPMAVTPPPQPVTPKPVPPPIIAAPAPAKIVSPPVVITSDDSTSVWGAYNGPRTAVPTVAGDDAVRHGTYGSPSLHLSRDYHFLDACTKVLVGDDEQTIFRDKETCPPSCFVEAEYLMWWVNNGNVPVLATTASDQMFGYLGAPTTALLLGPGSYGDSSFRNGIRLRAGGWFDDCHACGLDASVFVLSSQSTSTVISSDTTPTIARPFFAPNFGREFAEVVALPGFTTGRFQVDQTSFLWGMDVNLRRGHATLPIEWFAGFRNVNLKETLTMTERILATTNISIDPGNVDPAGTLTIVRDQFEVRNNFYGGQLGGVAGRRFGNVSLDGRASVALGVTHQELTIEGTQARTRPGQPTQNFTGGLLAVGPNLGQFDRDQFSVVPEATLNLGYYFREHTKVYIGYNFIGWSNVIRPGDQIDRVVNLTYVPNAPAGVPASSAVRPQPTFKQSDLVIHGLQIGLQGAW